MTTNTYRSEAGFTLNPDENALSTIIDLCTANPDLVLFHRPSKFDWVEVTASEFLAEVRALAKGLIANGIEAGDRVVLHSNTRYEWTLADLAIWSVGAATVPVYPSSSAHQIQWIIEDSGAKLAFTESRDNTAAMEHLLVGEGGQPRLSGSPSQLQRIVEFNSGGLDELKAEGADVSQELVDARVAGITHDTLASIVYTSGTTGRPKGVNLTHLNWYHQATALGANPIGAVAKPGRHVVTFLPLAHVLQRAVSLALTMHGATQSHWGDTGTLTVELQRAKPHMVLGVPRVFEKVRGAAYNKAADGSGIGKKVFLAAERAAIAYSRALDTPQGPGPLLKAQVKVFDKLVYSKVKAAIGGRAEYGITGGSAMSAELSHFFRGMGIPIYEGYGLTETTAAACVNNSEHCRIGTVGRPVNGYAARISADGEIEISGDGVFTSYWNNPEATENAVTDGWFNTGDLGEIDDDGFVRITGRKKDLIVTAGGKNVSPGPLEEIIRQDPLVSNALVVGDGKPFVGLLVTLDAEELKRWKAENNVPESKSLRQLAHDAELRAAVQDAVNVANATVSRAEAIKKFRILERDLSEKDDEMTPTMKVKRNVVAKRFAREIEELYKR
ncbi:long-chain fatty acid--CoA ligase [Corynebacterium qintianiae]|uniref:Acyl-CoA synthetase n=1 Tax=Corynebacterium qintianiae TaxID=2709392 RepID=A0A7T0PDC9_9CORY|nr:long-chain fatty acid--CoA ligase [Corynebacterium qintianiae]QPK82813.1 long-chain fatty acid--CoA ligase [Corynebacterium qintianiae]